jgi:hypothetical protein
MRGTGRRSDGLTSPAEVEDAGRPAHPGRASLSQQLAGSVASPPLFAGDPVWEDLEDERDAEGEAEGEHEARGASASGGAAAGARPADDWDRDDDVRHDMDSQADLAASEMEDDGESSQSNELGEGAEEVEEAAGAAPGDAADGREGPDPALRAQGSAANPEEGHERDAAARAGRDEEGDRDDGGAEEELQLEEIGATAASADAAETAAAAADTAADAAADADANADAEADAAADADTEADAEAGAAPVARAASAPHRAGAKKRTSSSDPKSKPKPRKGKRTRKPARGRLGYSLGIADSDDDTVTDKDFAGLGVRKIRAVVPYDVALRPEDNPRRAEFTRWIRAARRAKPPVEPMVSLGPSNRFKARVKRPGEKNLRMIAPTPHEYAVAFRAFRAAFPRIRQIGAWNEPNFHNAVLKNGKKLEDAPRAAAEYWRIAHKLAPKSFVIVAGEFSGDPRDPFWKKYARALGRGGVRPKVWALHSYHATARNGRVGRGSVPSFLQFLDSHGPSWRNGKVWLNEVGAFKSTKGDKRFSPAAQDRALRLILDMPKHDKRIKRIYYYNYKNEGNPHGDTGLLKEDHEPGRNRRRKAYNTFKRYAAKTRR